MNFYLRLILVKSKRLLVSSFLLLLDMVDLQPHVTLGLAEGAKAVESGPDQVEVQKLIAEGAQPKRRFEIKLGEVQDWGDKGIYVNLRKPLVYRLMLCPYFD